MDFELGNACDGCAAGAIAGTGWGDGAGDLQKLFFRKCQKLKQDFFVRIADMKVLNG